MAVCSWCLTEMTTTASCSVTAFHRDGVHIPLNPYGHGRRRSRESCGDCGVAHGGWHHPGCDLQRCPVCRGQLISCGCRFDEDGPDGISDDEFDSAFDDDEIDETDEMGAAFLPLGVDANGMPMEEMFVGGTRVIVHHGDVPLSDITTISGIRCTTPLRTVIDLAPEVEPHHLTEMVLDCLERRLFTVNEARRRLRQPDMATHPGAERVRLVLQQAQAPT